MPGRTSVVPLDAAWQFREVPEPGQNPALQLPWQPAQVPGHVHLDLLRAGVIPDPFVRLQEAGVSWVDERDWQYQGRFSLDTVPEGETYLRFQGLDTVAEIELNGEVLGAADNMFVPHEFKVSGKLRRGENLLSVTFRSAERVGLERRRRWEESGEDSMPADHSLWGARSFVRKAQYMFGWDWGPVLISCGIWRPVELVNVPLARLTDWHYQVDLDGDRATVTVVAAVERGPESDDLLTLDATLGDVSSQELVRPGDNSVTLRLEVEKPSLWAPDHPTLYPLALSLRSDTEEVDRLEARIGLRAVQLIQEPDADGSGQGFMFRVNGQDIFCKGANWIPADSFPSRAYDVPQRLRPLLQAAREAGVNMLRVWGGGLYESETFYGLCDELGILVWQDFPYACAYYPDGEKHRQVAKAEAVSAVRRIRHHPSLALWCGNNENQQMWHDKWHGVASPRFLGQPLYDQVLPSVVAEEDPGTPYWPGSAFGGENPNSPDVGDRHNWDVWHGQGDKGDWIHYRDDRSRFSSEFGFASSCGLAAWDSCLALADREPRSPAVRWHKKTGKPYDVYLGYIERHFARPETLNDLVYYSQLNQAEAMKCAVEHYRRLKGRCWGTLIWQLNDCWPVQSWSLIDYRREPKAAYYAARRFYAPVLLSLLDCGAGAEVHLTNDLPQAIDGELQLTLATLDGETLYSERLSAAMRSNGTGQVASFPLDRVEADRRRLYLHAAYSRDEKVVENLIFLTEPRDLNLPDPALSWRVEEPEEEVRLTLEAQRFAAYVWLSLPDVPLTWQDNFFHLRPGESRSVGLVRPQLPLSAGELEQRLRVRTLGPT